MSERALGAAKHLACVHVPSRDILRFDLLMSRWPGTPHRLPESLANPWMWLAVRRSEWDRVPELELWLKHFPEIRDLDTVDGDVMDAALCRMVLRQSSVVSLHYGLGPPADPSHLEEQRVHQDRMNAALGRSFRAAVQAAGQSEGTLFGEQWSAGSALGNALEARVGLIGAVRAGGTLRGESPGLVLSLLDRLGVSLSQLTPRQLEELVASLFEAEGWSVELTPQTRDGGKDIVAVTRQGGDTILAYVEVKHPRRGKTRVRAVREFIGVLCVDGVRNGYLVSSGAFTKDATHLAESLAPRVVDLHPVEGRELRRRIAMVSERSRGIFRYEPKQVRS